MNKRAGIFHGAFSEERYQAGKNCLRHGRGMKEMTEKKNIILLDGAVGTSLWEKSDDKVPVWRYNLE